MSDIDWSKAPEGAQTYEVFEDHLYSFCRGSEYFTVFGGWLVKKYPHEWKVIATRPTAPQPGQRKTVEDAVDYYSGAWCGAATSAIGFGVEDGFFAYDPRDALTDGEYLVCTREEFEACAAKSEPKWTHIGMRNQKCVIITQIANKAWIKYDDGRECVKPLSELKPIKPTITKAEAFDKLNSIPGMTLEELHENFNVEGAA